MQIGQAESRHKSGKKRVESRRDGPRLEDGRANYSLDQLDLMDRRFVEAMLAAIEAGLEHASIGVVTVSTGRRP
jgi:hypothetical protein